VTNDRHDRVMTVKYTNWNGKTSIRTVTVLRTFWGSNKYHPQPQQLLEVFDHDKMANRTYALAECDFTVSDTASEVDGYGV